MIKCKAYLVPVVMVTAYMFFWNAPKINFTDPWYEAFSIVNAATKTPNTFLRQKLLEKGGKELKDLCRKYPYHARVHYLLGCYFEYIGQYDSAIVQAGEAVRLGSGAVVNQVDGLAEQLRLSATAKKASLDKQ
jgi:hypothetical protein